MSKEGCGGDARAKSLAIFQAHQKAESLAELKEVDSFVERRVVPKLAPLWARTLVFEEGDSHQSKDDTTVEAVTRGVLRRLSCRFGLSGRKSEAKKAQEVLSSALSVTSKKGKRKKSEEAEMTSVQLDLIKLFSEAVDADAAPINLELCSGGGEWLAAQAKRDPSACWMACELRQDRAAHCFQRFALQGLSNGRVGLLAGDAVDALQHRLCRCTCSHLFVNHPTPPHQTDLETAAEGNAETATHLLTASFLRNGCAKLLVPGGTLTICTDSPEYGRWLMKTLSEPPLSKLFEDALMGTDADLNGHFAKVGKVRLRNKPPPVEVCGAEYSGENGASYFQRLKRDERDSRGQEVDRWFLCLRRQ